MSSGAIRGLIVLICLLFFCLINLYLRFFKYKIQKAKSFEKSLELRKKAFKLLKVVSLVIKIFESVFVYFVILSVLFTLLKFQSGILNFMILVVTFVIYVCIMYSLVKGWIKNKAMVTFYLGRAGFREFSFSFYTKHQYLKDHSNYFLYLRGFDDDLYDTGSSFGNPFKLFTRRRFKEDDFVEHLSQYASDVVAVGSPQEANCPKGATRVYLDNNTWQNDVHELMEKSEEIYILLHDSPACIWEIANSASMLHKTTFIANDKNVYNQIVTKCNKDILPKDINLKKDEIAFISFKSNAVNIEILKHNNKSYAKFLKTSYELCY